MKANLFKLWVIVLCWLPLIANGQTDSYDGFEEREEPKPIMKGWYFGLNVGNAQSFFRYEIPYDPVTGYTGTKSGGWLSFGYKEDKSYEISNGRKMMFETNARYIAGRFISIDFSNVVKEDGGNIVLYSDKYNGNKPNIIYPLKLVTNHFAISPNIFIGSAKYNVFFGLGLGVSSVISRSGSLDRIYQFKTFTPLYRANVGFSVKIAGGFASLNLSANKTGNIAFSNWRSELGFNTATIGYALPLSAFKKNPKSATL